MRVGEKVSPRTHMSANTLKTVLTGGITMNNEKYPCIINRSGKSPKEYIGIMFNGDQGVYRKETAKFLKKSGASKELIKAVKAAKGDLELSRILIEANQYDALVNVFNSTDSRTAILDYLDELYQGVVGGAKIGFSHLEEEISKVASKLNKNADSSDIDAAIAEFDKSIQARAELACKKLETIHNETAKNVIEKYHAACERKLKKLKEEIQAIQDEKERLGQIIQKIS